VLPTPSPIHLPQQGCSELCKSAHATIPLLKCLNSFPVLREENTSSLQSSMPCVICQAYFFNLTSHHSFHLCSGAYSCQPWPHIKVTWEAFKPSPVLDSVQDQWNLNLWQWTTPGQPLQSTVHMFFAFPGTLSFNLVSPPATCTQSFFKHQDGLPSSRSGLSVFSMCFQRAEFAPSFLAVASIIPSHPHLYILLDLKLCESRNGLALVTSIFSAFSTVPGTWNVLRVF
jgi:hypothetical protein